MNINCDSNQNVCCPESDNLQSKNYSEDTSLTNTDTSTDSTTPDQYSSLDPKKYYNESLKLCEAPLFSETPVSSTQAKRFPLSPLNQLRANVDDSSRPMVNRISDGAFLGILEMVGAIFSPAPLLGCAAAPLCPQEIWCTPDNFLMFCNGVSGVVTTLDQCQGPTPICNAADQQCEPSSDAGPSISTDAGLCSNSDGGMDAGVCPPNQNTEQDGGTIEGTDGGITDGGLATTCATIDVCGCNITDLSGNPSPNGASDCSLYVYEICQDDCIGEACTTSNSDYQLIDTCTAGTTCSFNGVSNATCY